MRISIKNSSLVFILTGLSMLLVGCGGGGGSSDNGSSNGTSGDTGFVTLVAGDDDISNFDEALFDISSIRLLGDDDQGSIVLLDEMRQIDFLALETVNEVLAETEVPVGSYNKLRFQVDTITLIQRDELGDITQEIDVRVLANGKVDVLIKDGFDVEADQSLVLAIDVDLGKSIKLTQAGNGSYKFRPVIFADIITVDNPSGLVRIAGEFESVLENEVRRNDRFKICDADLMSDNDDVAESTSCRLVLVAEATGVFAPGVAQIETALLDDFNNGDSVVVYGRFSPMTSESLLDNESDEVYGTAFDAFVVANGSYQQFEGVAQTEFDAVLETFDITLDEGQGVAGDLTVSAHLPLADGAKLFTKDGEPAEIDIISNGAVVELEGLLILDVPNNIDAFIAIVKPALSETVINGAISGIDFSTFSLLLVDAEAVEYCVTVNDDTQLLQLTEMDDTVEVTTVDLSTLADANVEVTGVEDSESGCITASAVVISTLAP